MVTSVTLSTGTIINIPIFSAVPTGSGDVVKVTRSGGILADYSAQAPHNPVYTPLTNAELLELYNMMTGSSCTTLELDIPQNVFIYGHYVSHINWVYDSLSNKYVLNLMMTGVNETASMRWGNYDCTAGPSYYDDKNHHNGTSSPQFPYVDFWELGEPGAIFTQASTNIRPGALYSIDIYTKNNYTEPYNYTYLHGYSAYTEAQVLSNITDYINNHPDQNIDYDENDNPYVNPYGVVISEPGGGDGDIDLDPDEITKAEIPALPTVSAVDAGLITMYNCTAGQLQVLGNYLWSNAYDLDANFTKLFASPMEAIIGLSIIPVTPTLGGASTVKFGNIDTHRSMSKLATQFVEKDMGSISVKKWIGSFMDYSPYVKLSLYLPYIGYREISPDDVVGDTIHVVYHIDCLSGGCCAMVETGKKGLLYSFDGSCIANVPINALNYSGALQNAISAATGGVSMIAGVATGNPVAAVGGAASVAQNVTNIKPSIQRSGQMSGAAGLMSYQKPMLIIERPNMCVPENLNTYTGNMLYVSRKLSQCKGFTQVSLIHLDGIPCTEKERNELMTLLNKGVIF